MDIQTDKHLDIRDYLQQFMQERDSQENMLRIVKLE